MTAADFFDQVLDQIELGYPAEAIARLMGMLDIAADESSRLGDLGVDLHAHPLFDLLKHDAAVALSCSRAADRIGQLVNQIAAPRLGPALSMGPASGAAAMLRAAVADSAFNRAIRARVHHSGEVLNRAWQAGRSIAVTGGTLPCELIGLIRRDLSNLTIAEPEPAQAAGLRQQLGTSAQIYRQAPAAFLAGAVQRRARFDLIYFPRALDTLRPDRVAALLEQAAQILAPGGMIVMPAFRPMRIGRGWQQICLNWPVLDHTDAALLAIAPGQLSARVMSDSAGCFSWLAVTQSAGQDQMQPMSMSMGGRL